MEALTLQQFQYTRKKNFLRRLWHLVFPVVFCQSDAPPPWGGGGLQRGAGGGGGSTAGQVAKHFLTEPDLEVPNEISKANAIAVVVPGCQQKCGAPVQWCISWEFY